MALEASLGNPGIPKKLFIPLLFPLFGLSSLHVTDSSLLSLNPCHIYATQPVFLAYGFGSMATLDGVKVKLTGWAGLSLPLRWLQSM